MSGDSEDARHRGAVPAKRSAGFTNAISRAVQITAGYEFMWTDKAKRIFFPFFFFKLCNNILMLILSAALEICGGNINRVSSDLRVPR